MQKNDILRNYTPHTTIHCVHGRILGPEEINVTCGIVTQVGTMDSFLYMQNLYLSQNEFTFSMA